MYVLGVDPGIRNTGWCVLNDDAEAIDHGVITPPGRGKLLVSQVLGYVLPVLQEVMTTHLPSSAVVEEVTWYGKSRRTMLPLAQVAGGIAGFLWDSNNIHVYMLIANMRSKETKWPASWSEHERDAAALAKTIHLYETAELAEDVGYLKKHSAVSRRIIIAAPSALGKRSRKG